MTEPIDRSRMRAQWQARGRHWDAQADRVADMADRLNQPLIGAADIAPGHQVLDLASGAGEPALTLARLVGPTGRVTATDLVEEMLAGCRRRAAAAGIDNMEFAVADMEDLDFPDAAFDRLTCRFGIMFVADPAAALTAARRVLKPGGRAAYLVWGPRDETTFFAVMHRAAGEVLGDDSRLDLDHPFRFGAPGALADLVEAAGFADVTDDERRFTPEAPADRPFWHPQLEMTMGPALAEAEPGTREALDEAIRAGLAPHRHGDVYRLRACVRIVSGRAP